MAGGTEEASSDKAAPEAVIARKEFRCRWEPEIQHLKLVRRAGDLGNVRPAAWNLTEYHEETENRAAYIEEHLYHIGPDHRR